MIHTLWNRRSFLGALGSTAALAATPSLGNFACAESRNLAFVATPNNIHTLHSIDNAWQTAHSIAALQPSALALSPDGKALYAANSIDRSHNLPTGSVTSYRIAHDGSLQPAGNATLALAAIHPYAIAVSPDSTLLAAASEGGIVSLLALAPDGTPGHVFAAHKLITVHPLRIAFITDGHLTVTANNMETTLHVSPRYGVQALSRRSASPHQTSPLTAYGVADARAVVTLPA